MKIIIITFIIFSFLSDTLLALIKDNINNEAKLKQQIVVVIDPGHGGEAPGAISPLGVKEKTITLSIAKKLKAFLEKENYIKPLLTREDDTYISLKERCNFANKNNAYLFLSIHANASTNGEASGFETYFLSFEPKDNESKLVAERENEEIYSEKDKINISLDDLKAILLDMGKTETLRISAIFAEMVQEELAKILPSPNRGVKQAPLFVLAYSNMPSILVEVGFISHKEESKSLNNSFVQSLIVRALGEAIIKFINSYNNSDKSKGDTSFLYPNLF